MNAQAVEQGQLQLPIGDPGQRWITMLDSRLESYYSKERKVSPCYQVRASSIGYPSCQIYQMIKNWKFKRPFSRNTLERFSDGNWHERAVITLLEDAGFNALHRQLDGEVKFRNKTVATAHLDTVLQERSTKDQILAEIKSMKGTQFDKMNSLGDMLASPWYAQYYDQIQAYLEAFNKHLPFKDGALLILKNKSDSCLKYFYIAKDKGRILELKHKAADIHQALEMPEPKQEEWLAARRVNNLETCEKCDYFVPCKPNVEPLPLELNIEGEESLAELLRERAKVLAAGQEFARIDRRVKDALKKHPFKRALIGDFVVEKTEGFRKGFTVPDGNRVEITIKAIGEVSE